MIALIDLDGTVADNYALHEQAYRLALENPRFNLGARFGLPTTDVVDAITAKRKTRMYRQLLQFRSLPLIDGALESLKSLRANGHAIVLWTNASPYSAMATLDALVEPIVFDSMIIGNKIAVAERLPSASTIAFDDDARNLIPLQRLGWTTYHIKEKQWPTTSSN
jgi:FMN phosphatase YigB (HAD superfamily)